MSFSLEGRSALVTGSSRGLGLQIAKGLAAAGARVILNGRDRARLKQALDRLRATGLDADLAVFDVADSERATGVIDRAAEAGAPIDILVNNVGQRDRRPFADVTAADLSRLLAVDLVAPYALAQAVANQLARLDRPGRIINISSIGARLASPFDAAYPIAKAGLESMTREGWALCARPRSLSRVLLQLGPIRDREACGLPNLGPIRARERGHPSRSSGMVVGAAPLVSASAAGGSSPVILARTAPVPPRRRSGRPCPAH